MENVIYEVKNGIGYITINRPKVLNALDVLTLEEIKESALLAGKDKEAKVVIITGAGGRAFVAGADISAMQKMTPEEAYEYARLGQTTYNVVSEIPKIVIAAIDGFALGGGCELAMAYDIRIASKKTKIGIPEVTLGVFPGFAGSQRLPRLVGRSRAKIMLATGAHVPAEEAKSYGLIDEVVEENPVAAAEELAAKIMKNSLSAIALGKKAMNEGMEMELYKGIEHEAALFAVAFSTPDQREGMTAFLEKRSPNFNN
ncbi:MAG: enoyl-CoA hydratase/isomerase family protein [Oscillospiraceae bacterium]|nr:enoyl-CoA hydratase/isomerase family protein [Oscillospiraceae bacterium]